jgi:hypothetical protein
VAGASGAPTEGVVLSFFPTSSAAVFPVTPGGGTAATLSPGERGAAADGGGAPPQPTIKRHEARAIVR